MPSIITVRNTDLTYALYSLFKFSCTVTPPTAFTLFNHTLNFFYYTLFTDIKRVYIRMPNVLRTHFSHTLGIVAISSFYSSFSNDIAIVAGNKL